MLSASSRTPGTEWALMNIYWSEYKDICVPQTTFTFLLCCIFGVHFPKDDFHKSIPNLFVTLIWLILRWHLIELERKDKIKCGLLFVIRENEKVLTDIEGEIENHFSDIYLSYVSSHCLTFLFKTDLHKGQNSLPWPCEILCHRASWRKLKEKGKLARLKTQRSPWRPEEQISFGLLKYKNKIIIF